MTFAAYERVEKANPYHRGKGAEGGRFTSKEEAGREGPANATAQRERMAPSATKDERARRAALIRAMRSQRDAETELTRRGLLGMSISDRRQHYYAATTPAERQKLNDAKNTITARMAEIVGRRSWDRSMEGAGTAEAQTAAFRASVAARLASFVKDGTIPEDTARIARRKADALDDAMAAHGVAPDKRRPIVRLFTDALIAQEHEAVGRSLGDHGVRHLMTDSELAERAYELVQTSGGAGAGRALASGPPRVAFLLAGAFHDMGYLTPAGRYFLDDDHPADSASWYEQHAAPVIADAFNPSFAADVNVMIRTHGDTNLDWQRDVPASAFRLADNLALFHAEKSPGLVRYAPRTRGVLQKLAAGEIDADEAKRTMRGIVDARTDLHPKLRARLKDAVAEVSPIMPKLTLGMWSGSVAGMRFDRKARSMEVEVDVTSSKATAALYRMADLGYRQFAKLAKTFGAKPPDQWKGDETFEMPGLRFRLLKGTAVRRGRLTSAVAAMADVPPHIAQALRASLGVDAIQKSAEQRLVTGWASVIADANGVPIVDVQDDLIELHELEQAARTFMREGGTGGVLHIADAEDNPVRIGRVVESMIVSPDLKKALDLPATMPLGWLITVHVEEDAVWDAVKRGELQAFSIGGTAEREPVAKYDPAQPRQPKGVPEGGQWVSSTHVSVLSGPVDVTAVPAEEAAWRAAHRAAYGHGGIAVRVHGDSPELRRVGAAAAQVVKALPAQVRKVVSEQHARMHYFVTRNGGTPGDAVVHVFASAKDSPDGTEAVAYYAGGGDLAKGDDSRWASTPEGAMVGSFGVLVDSVYREAALGKLLRSTGDVTTMNAVVQEVGPRDLVRALSTVMRHEASHAIDAHMGPLKIVDRTPSLEEVLRALSEGRAPETAMKRSALAQMWSSTDPNSGATVTGGTELVRAFHTGAQRFVNRAQPVHSAIGGVFDQLIENRPMREWSPRLTVGEVPQLSRAQAAMWGNGVMAQLQMAPELFADVSAWLLGAQTVRSTLASNFVPFWGEDVIRPVARALHKSGIPVLRPEYRRGRRRPAIEAKVAPRRETALLGKWLREVRKFNPYHDERGRFTTAAGGGAGGLAGAGQGERMAETLNDRYAALGAIIERHGPDWMSAVAPRPTPRPKGVTLGDVTQLAGRMEEALRSSGGFTLDARTRQPVTEGIAVGVFPEKSASFPVGELSTGRVEGWLKGLRPALLADPKLKIGGWLDGDTGTVWLDVTRVYHPDLKPLAIRMGQRKNQISIADLAAVTRGDWDHALIPTGGTGRVPEPVSKQAASRPVFLLFDGDATAEEIVAAIRSHLPAQKRS